MYVDDSTTSFCSFNQGVKFYTKAKKCLSTGSFDLRKWETNDLKLRDYINNHEQPLEFSEISESELTYIENKLRISDNYRRVLGLNWNIGKDIFVLSGIAEKGLWLVYTKQNIMKLGASFFDPLGLVCLVVLQAKLLFQELRELKVDWDEIFDGDVAKKWDSLLKDLKDCGSICMPRFELSYVRERIVSLELHGFCDSSKVVRCEECGVGESGCEFVEC